MCLHNDVQVLWLGLDKVGPFARDALARKANLVNLGWVIVCNDDLAIGSGAFGDRVWVKRASSNLMSYVGILLGSSVSLLIIIEIRPLYRTGRCKQTC